VVLQGERAVGGEDDDVEDEREVEPAGGDDGSETDADAVIDDDSGSEADAGEGITRSRLACGVWSLWTRNYHVEEIREGL
jgi:hypothetical protein